MDRVLERTGWRSLLLADLHILFIHQADEFIGNGGYTLHLEIPTVVVGEYTGLHRIGKRGASEHCQGVHGAAVARGNS